MDADREKALKARLSAYLDGELSEEERAEVRAWVEQYADARALLDELRATVEVLGSLPRAEASGEMLEGLRSRLERRALLDELPESAGEETPVPMFSVGRWLSAAAVIALSGVALYFTWSSQEPGTVDRDRFARLDKQESVQPAAPEETEVSDEAKLAEEEHKEETSYFARLRKVEDRARVGGEIVHAVPAAKDRMAGEPKAKTEEVPPSSDDLTIVAMDMAEISEGVALDAEATPSAASRGLAEVEGRAEIRHDLSLHSDEPKKPTAAHREYAGGGSYVPEGKFAAEAPAETLGLYGRPADAKEASAADVELKVVELVYADEGDIRETLDWLDARYASKTPALQPAAGATSRPAAEDGYAGWDNDGDVLADGAGLRGRALLHKQTTTMPASGTVTSLALTLPSDHTFDQLLTWVRREADRGSLRMRVVTADPRGVPLSARYWSFQRGAVPTSQLASMADLEVRKGGGGASFINGSFETKADDTGRKSEVSHEGFDMKTRERHAPLSPAHRGKALASAEAEPEAPTSQPAANQPVTLTATASLGEGADALAPVYSPQTPAAANLLRLYVYIDQPRASSTTQAAMSVPETQPATQPASAPARP